MRVAMRSCLVVLSLAMLTSPTIADETEKEAVAPPPGALEFVGRNLLAKAKGVFHEWRIVESIVDPDSIEEAYAIVEVSLDSVDTGIGRRDRHLRDPDFFETETYPVAIVRVHSPTPIEDESGEAPRFSVRFDIDLHGVKKTLDGEVRLVGTSPVVFEGGLTIDRTEFGVGPKPNRWNPMSPKAEIPVEFRVEL
jgi:polyisoprenoid-binding protein YceI